MGQEKKLQRPPQTGAADKDRSVPQGASIS
jgi:hypothetical protein